VEINAAGHLTLLGGSVLSTAVREAMAEAGRSYRDMRAYLAEAEAEVARACGAEGAYITAGAAAGIAIAVAGCVTRGDGRLVRQVPAVESPRREVAVQAGHLIDFGASVEQMVRLGGGLPRPAGTKEAIQPDDLARALGEATACFLWVQSHHTEGNASLSIEECLRLTRVAGVPFVVDAAAEEDLQAYVGIGADLVIYSGTKALKAPVSGLVAGREPYVSWCRAQSRGIARAMKVGKEQVAGLLVALREFIALDHAAERERQGLLLDRIDAGLRNLPGLQTLRLQDEAGRPIERLGIRFDEPSRARRLAEGLTANAPAIHTRPHRLPEGIVQFDPRCLREEDLPPIVEAVRRLWPLAEAG
jgi:uncharacterized pyridoxal phosphate-dependent enzyme